MRKQNNLYQWIFLISLLMWGRISVAQQEISIDDLGSFLDTQYAVPRIGQFVDKLKKTSQVDTRLVTLEEKDSLYQYTVEEGQEEEASKKLTFFIQLRNKTIYQIDFKMNTLLEQQVPEVVGEYIKEKILKPTLQSGAYLEAITQTLNAFKNATDPRFKEKLLSMAPPMLNETRYYPDHAYFSFPYYDFEAYHDDNQKLSIMTINIDRPELVSNKDYFVWNFEYSTTQSLTVPSSHLQIIKDKVSLPQPYEAVNDKDENINIPNNLSNLFGTLADKLTRDIKTICKDVNHYRYFSSVNDLDHIDKNLQDYRLKHYACRIKVLRKVTETGKLMEDQAINVFYGDDGVTWCNKYAEDLGEKIFGLNPWRIELNANAIYDKLLRDTENFVDISNIVKDPQLTWDKFINKGYIVFFCFKNTEGPGHIETGWPEGADGKQTIIGAGSTVSKKSFLNQNKKPFTVRGQDVTWEKNIKKFLYVGYLKMNFN